MTHTETERRALSAIPRERLRLKIQRTLAGLGLIALGFAGHRYVGWHPYVTAGFAVVGGVTASGELVLAPLRILVAMARDLIIAIRRGNGP